MTARNDGTRPDWEKLQNADNDALSKLWRIHFRRAPKPASRDIVIRKIAWAMQQKSLGGLSVATRKKLDRMIGSPVSVVIDRYHLAPGAVLKRTWNNQTFIVNVLGKKEFDYKGRIYSSLTTIAKEITGSHQSGPLFFGLRRSHDGAT